MIRAHIISRTGRVIAFLAAVAAATAVYAVPAAAASRGREAPAEARVEALPDAGRIVRGYNLCVPVRQQTRVITERGATRYWLTPVRVVDGTITWRIEWRLAGDTERHAREQTFTPDTCYRVVVERHQVRLHSREETQP